MEKVKISIVIPVFNAEKYLECMLDSILEQSFKDFEIIAVNDGSKDDSLKVLEQYKDKFKKFNIINQENTGSYRARMTGIKAAKGEYITILDCDDKIDKTFLEELYKSIKKEDADIAICGFNRVEFETNHIFSKEMCNHKKKIIDVEKNPEYLIQINTSLWNKLFKTQILKESIELKNIPKILDDMSYLTLIYLKVKKITFVDKPLYKYFVHKSSLITNIKEEDLNNTRLALREIREEYIKQKVNKDKLEVLTCLVFLHTVISIQYRLYETNKNNFKNVKKTTDLYMKKYFDEYKKTKYLKLSYSITHGFSNIKIAIMKIIYDLNLFTIFLKFYNFLINRLKIDIKW